MSDFHQYGTVTALPRLVERPLVELEDKVLALSKRYPVALVIPMIPAERVTRLLLTPLLAAFVRLIGDDPYIRYLSSFRYALSGEFAMRALRSSIDEFLADPLGAPLVPNWARVWAGVPDAGMRLMAAVAQGQGDLHSALARSAG